MTDIEFFTAALELPSPWYISKLYFTKGEKGKQLHIHFSHARRVKFEYESEKYPVYDHQERSWRHLNFFQYDCYLHASVPRVKTKQGKVKLIEVQWSKLGSSFSLLFEQDVLNLSKSNMSASAIGRRLGIGAKRVFRIIRRHVSHALATEELEDVKELSVDETSTKKGHNYITVLSDREERKVVGIAVGKNKEAFAHALIDMEVRGADRNKVKTVTMDMLRSYKSAVDEFIPQAQIVFDRFHIVKKLNEAVNEIRKIEVRQYKELRSSKYLWLKNNSNLSEEQRKKVNYLSETFPNIGTAYRLKELFRNVMNDAYYDHKLKPIKQWMKQAWESVLEPIQRFVKMLKKHWYGVKSYIKN